MTVRGWLLGAAALSGLALPAPASAVTIGKADPFAADKTHGRCDYVGVSYTDASLRVPPGGGTITSWSVSDNPVGTKFALIVLRQGEDGTFVVSHTDATTIRRPYAKNTFATHMAVQSGQLLALRVPEESDSSPTDCFYPPDGTTDPNGDMYANEGTLLFHDSDPQLHPLPDGARADPFGSYPGSRVNLEATLKPPHACIVPNVLTKHLARARRMLKHGNCRVGTVHGRRSRGVVVRQSRNGGAVLRWHARIELWLAKG